MLLLFQIKGDSLIVGPRLSLDSATGSLQSNDVIIYYIDDKAPEFTMQHLNPGIIAVIVIIILAIVAGILVLVCFSNYMRFFNPILQVKNVPELCNKATVTVAADIK